MNARSGPVSVGFIGAGNVLAAYLQALDRLVPRGEAVLGGICARNRRRWPLLRSRRPGVVLYEQVAELLASNVEVVVIVTPPDSHAELARAALTHGKHVLVEKPMAATAREAGSLMSLARRRGRLLVAAPFVQQSPTFAFLHQALHRGAIGKIHSARALYGNLGSDWAGWYHDSGLGALAEIGIYNLKSLTAILGPVDSVFHQETRSARTRRISGRRMPKADADVAHTVLRHAGGALSSIVSSHAMVQYERPALEFYGSTGTANLRGDDWDPRGVDIWREERGCWECYPAIEPTWLWTDGLSDLVQAVRSGRPALVDLAHDLHLMEILSAASRSSRSNRPVRIRTSWTGYVPPASAMRAASVRKHHLHDHTRPGGEQ
jgi:predicted dehydrogenase